MTIDTGSGTTSTRSSSTPEPSSWPARHRTPAGQASTEAANRTPRPSVTVVICAYTEQRWPQLQCAIESVLRQEVAPDHVVLVVDHNPELLRRAQAAYPRLTVAPNAGPRGLSGARNTGVSSATGEVIAFLDDDAAAEPDWLARMTAHYDDPRVLAVGGSAVPDWEEPRPRWLPPEFDWVVGCSFTGQPSAATPVRNLIGCNMSFRRSALEHAGRFDPALGRIGRVPFGCEETELCIRLQRHRPDGVVLYEPAAVVRHQVSGDRGTWGYFRHRCFSEGRSKAVVARRVGARSALSAERDYTRRVLPRGIWRGVQDGFTHRDLGGLLRAGAIVVGLLTTASGYLSYRRAQADQQAEPPEMLGPVRVLSVELSEGIPSIAVDGSASGAPYTAAQVLVRLHGEPLGLLRVPLPAGGLTGEQHGAAIIEQLGRSIEAHLERDGAGHHPALPTAGSSSGPCAVQWPPVSTPATVVVPTCGRTDILRRTLDSLTRIDYPDYEVLVVDNRPHLPGTRELVAAYDQRDGRVRYLAEPRRGSSNARNRGLAEASGQIVAFADDDVVVDRHWLHALAAGFLDEQVAAVTGLVVPSELETPAQLWIEQYGGFAKGCQRQRFDQTGFETEEDGGFRRVQAGPGLLYPYSPGVFGSGANLAFRTDVLRGLGGFDPLLGRGTAMLAGEDIDVLLRAVLDGRAIVYNPAAIVWHRHQPDLAALRDTMYAYGVGLSAVMTKTLLTNAAHRRELLRRLPLGIAYAVDPRSAKNHQKTTGYPASLTALELLGMAAGPMHYAVSAGGPLGARVRRRFGRSP
jgi:O-antigen biosynthesis protein